MISFGIFSFFGCSHIPKNEPGKEKVILVHGFGRSPVAMKKFEEYFEEAGYQVFSIGYSTLTQNIKGVKKEFYSKVDKHLNDVDDKVHFVGHSMGGLMVRSYLGDREVRNLGNVVILGTPSKGTPIVEYLRSKWFFGLAGPAVESLSSNGSKFLNSLKKPVYNLGVIAGFVSRAGREDVLPGADDGIVPVDSTKVEGMKDFKLLPESHYSMRYSPLVMKQVHFFLKNAYFHDS